MTRAIAALALALALALGCGNDGGRFVCGVTMPCLPDESCEVRSQTGEPVSCRCVDDAWECHRTCPVTVTDPTAPCFFFGCGDFAGCSCACDLANHWVCADREGERCTPQPVTAARS